MATRREKREKRQKRSVAGATARRREKADRAYSDMFDLPKGMEMFGVDSTGTKRIDIIPYVAGAGNPNAHKGDFYWERTFFIHRNVGVNDDWVICPARTAQKKCPICEYISKLQKDPDADEDTIKALQPSKRMIMNVRNLKKDPDKVMVWHISDAYFGKAMDEALSAAYEDENENMDNFCDPEGGYYLKCLAEVGWQGRGFSIERVDFVPRKTDLEEEILEQAVCLDEILVMKDYAELKKLFLAEDEEEGYDGNEDEEDKPKHKKSKKSKLHKRPKDDEEDEEAQEAEDDDDQWEDDDAEDSEPEEEEAESSEDDDEEWGDDEENWDDDEQNDEDESEDKEEDEEPAPKRSKKKKTKKKSRH